MDLGDTLRAELDVGREEGDALVGEERGLDEGWGNNALLALHGLKEVLGEIGGGWM